MQIKDFLTQTSAEMAQTCLHNFCVYLIYSNDIYTLGQGHSKTFFNFFIKSHTWVKKSIEMPMPSWQESVRLERLAYSICKAEQCQFGLQKVRFCHLPESLYTLLKPQVPSRLISSSN